MQNNKLVSIVVPIVHNDRHIAECIEAIKQSTYIDYEIIVVDEGLERSAQRNIGIRRAKGDYLLWLDSDMMIVPELIQDCVDKMEANPDCAGIFIPERVSTEGWFGRLRDWERQFLTGTLVDVVRFVRLPTVFFDETLHGVEDSDWERRVHGKRMVSDYYFNHHDKIGLIKYLRKKAYYAKCLGKYKAKNPDDKLLTFKYRCWDVYVQNSKWKRLIRKPHYAFGVMLLLLARGIIAICVKKS